MTAATFVTMLVCLILLILVIGRIQGSPKTSVNLILALVFGVVVGLGIRSCNNSKKDTQIEKVSTVNHIAPMQALPATSLAIVSMVNNKPAGQVKWFTKDTYIQQQILVDLTFTNVGDSPAYEDSS